VARSGLALASRRHSAANLKRRAHHGAASAAAEEGIYGRTRYGGGPHSCSLYLAQLSYFNGIGATARRPLGENICGGAPFPLLTLAAARRRVDIASLMAGGGATIGGAHRAILRRGDAISSVALGLAKARRQSAGGGRRGIWPAARHAATSEGVVGWLALWRPSRWRKLAAASAIGGGTAHRRSRHRAALFGGDIVGVRRRKCDTRDWLSVTTALSSSRCVTAAASNMKAA